MSKSKETDVDRARREKAAQRDAIIMAALPHVPFDGWSEKTLAAAAENTGASAGSVRRFFPGGVKDAIAHFIDLADRLMLEDLQAYDLPSMKVRARVTIGVRLRLERWTNGPVQQTTSLPISRLRRCLLHREILRKPIVLSRRRKHLKPSTGFSLKSSDYWKSLR